MSFKLSFKSIEIGRLSQFERKVIPNGWRCDAKSVLRLVVYPEGKRPTLELLEKSNVFKIKDDDDDYVRL